MEVVLVDNDIVIREALKIVLQTFHEKSRIKINFFSASNGLEGMGMVYALVPDIIILDLTLPRYSGSELYRILATNPRFTQRGMVLLLQETNQQVDFNLPKNFIALNKSSNWFIHDFLALFERSMKVNLDFGFFDNLKFFIAQRLIIWANWSDRIMYNMISYNYLIKILMLLPFFFTQLVSGFYLGILSLISPRLDDLNIKQRHHDDAFFRVRAYPSLALILSPVLVLFVQIILLIFGLSLTSFI